MFFKNTLIRILFLLCFSLTAFAEPQNLSLLRQEVELYHDSGRYQKDLAQVIQAAHDYVIHAAKSNTKHQKLALVLDIDETSLSNYNHMIKRNFIGDHDQIHKEILEANAPPIKPTLALYQDALKHGVKVFFITGRRESERQATRTNLIQAGYTHWSGLYLRPNDYPKHSIIPFKSQSRAKIAHKGYTIIASIGDQFSDIRGGYMQKGFKLPNPYYYLP